MNWYIIQFRKWYENRITRERVLLLILSWAILYFLFHHLIFKPINARQAALQADIKALDTQIDTWNMQLEELNKLSQSPLYKQWIIHRRSFVNLQHQYQYLMKTPAAKQWQDVIKTILLTQSNITLAQIKNFPEAAYNPTNLPSSLSNIYQQKLLMVFYSNYFDTLNYIKKLESALPTVHWDTLRYQVAQYPVANVEMEFSILYEKGT